MIRASKDPRTGQPARDNISVTVIHEQAARADAAATALVVAGDEWPRIAASLGIDHVMLMRADGQIEMTAAMAEQVRLSDPNQTPLIRQVP